MEMLTLAKTMGTNLKTFYKFFQFEADLFYFNEI